MMSIVFLAHLLLAGDSMILAPVPPGWAIARIFTSALCRSYSRKYGEKETFGWKVIVALAYCLPLGRRERTVLFWDGSGEALGFKIIFVLFLFFLSVCVCVCVWFLLDFYLVPHPTFEENSVHKIWALRLLLEGKQWLRCFLFLNHLPFLLQLSILYIPFSNKLLILKFAQFWQFCPLPALKAVWGKWLSWARRETLPNVCFLFSSFSSFPLAFLSLSFSFYYVPAPIPLSFWGICLIENIVEMPKNLEWFFSFFFSFSFFFFFK